MLFCMTAEYTPQALNAMRENPNTDRRAAVEQLLAAAGGKLVAMYGRAANGPGAMVIFDVPDPAMAPAVCGVAVSAGTIRNVELTGRLVGAVDLPRLLSNVGNLLHCIEAGQLDVPYGTG